MHQPTPDIIVSSESQFISQQSEPKLGRFVFSYTITIENRSNLPYQLMSRHWIIQDGNMKIEEVYGDGVIGEQPIIPAGKSYSYTSGAVLETDMGTMEGRYFFSDLNMDKGNGSSHRVEITIPKFLLSIPRTVH